MLRFDVVIAPAPLVSSVGLRNSKTWKPSSVEPRVSAGLVTVAL